MMNPFLYPTILFSLSSTYRRQKEAVKILHNMSMNVRQILMGFFESSAWSKSSKIIFIAGDKKTNSRKTTSKRECQG